VPDLTPYSFHALYAVTSHTLKFFEKKMNELLEGTSIEKAIHLVIVCDVTAYKACKLYGVKSGTLSVHLSGKVKSEVKGRPAKFTVEEEKTLLETFLVKMRHFFSGFSYKG